MTEHISTYLLRRYAEKIQTKAVNSNGSFLSEEEKAALHRSESSIKWDEISEICRIEWTSDPKSFPVEISFFLDVFDWELGRAAGSLEHSEILAKDTWEDLATQYDQSYWRVDLSGLCFDLHTIEMLAPGAQAPASDLLNRSVSAAMESPRKGGPGRRREYDWDGALLYLIGQAELNDIAPDPDAHGAQADIKRLLADWFSENGGKVPADSQLQGIAKRALEAIKSAKP